MFWLCVRGVCCALGFQGAISLLSWFCFAARFSICSLTGTYTRKPSPAAALITLLLPIEIHVPVCEPQVTHRPTIAGFTPTDELRHSGIAATWYMEQRSCTGRRSPRCSSWFLKTAFKTTYNSRNIRVSCCTK